MGAVGSLIQVRSASPAPPACGLLVPAYFYFRGARLAHWDTLIQEAAREPRLEIVAIVNPASGPGRRVDAAYMQVLERCRKAGVKAGVKAIGYVSTDYSRRCGEGRPRAPAQLLSRNPGHLL